MDKVLILRSVSLQQLDRNLPAIQAAFPGAEFHLLTHPHALGECRKYPGLAQVLPLPSAGPFSPWRLPPGLRREGYAAAVVPVANRSGAGFLNVFLAAWATGARSVYGCNLVSEMNRVSRPGLLLRWLRGWLLRAAALLPFLPLAVAALPVLAAGLLLGRRVRSGCAR